MRDLRRFAAVQIVIDGVIETALCYLTGGVYSFASILFFGSILASALCVSGRMSVVFASAATVALAAIQAVYYYAVLKGTTLPFVQPVVLEEHVVRVGNVAAYLISQGIALHLVAGLSSWLGRELNRRLLAGEIIATMPEGLVAIDANERIEFINREAMQNVFEYKGGRNLVGCRLKDVFHRSQDAELLEDLRSGKSMKVERLVRMRNGTRRAIEVKTSVLRNARGERRGTIGIFTDLTLKRQAEEAEKRAERLEGIEALAMGIAHEVRNPLASIRGCVQELGRVEYLGEDERQLARIVCRASDRLDAIIGEFMRFARLKPPELHGLDLANFMREIAILLERRLPPGGRVKLKPDLIENARVRGDAHQLTQVFLNLGINAIEAMEKAGGTLSIGLRDSRSVRHAPTPPGGFRVLEEVRSYEVVFEDTGPGIAAEDLPRVFEPFFTTKPGGTGLGLAIAERIVKQHGGTIAVESMPECGATFRVQIPAETPEAAAAPTPEPEPAPTRAAGTMKG